MCHSFLEHLYVAGLSVFDPSFSELQNTRGQVAKTCRRPPQQGYDKGITCCLLEP